VILRLIFVLSNLASQIARGQNRKYQSVIINFFSYPVRQNNDPPSGVTVCISILFFATEQSSTTVVLICTNKRKLQYDIDSRMLFDPVLLIIF
jgi:hypothetical protein